MDIRNRINIQYHSLSSSEMLACDTILNNIDDIITLTITEFSEKHNISYSSILRFIKKINYSGIEIFRYDLKQSIERENTPSLDQSFTETLVSPLIAQLGSLDFSQIELKLKTIIDYISGTSGIVSTGVGASVIVSDQFAHHMLPLGYSVATMNDVTKLDWFVKTNSMSQPTLYIIYSVSGTQSLYTSMIHHIRNTEPASKVFLVTMNPYSEQLDLVDDSIVLPVSDASNLKSKKFQGQYIEPRILMYLFNSLLFNTIANSK